MRRVRSQYRQVAQGQSEKFRPSACRYQLAQPVLHTVPRNACCNRSLNLACTCGLTLMQAAPRLRTARDALEHVMNLRLDHEDDGVVPEPGVRPDQLVQVRIAGDVDAVVGLRAVAPVVAQRVARQAGDDEVLHVDAWIHDETRAEDDAVHRPRDAVVGDDAVVTHFPDPLGHQFDVRPVEHRVPRVRDQDPLAAERVVGRECRDQRRIRDLAAQHLQSQRPRHADQRGVQQPQQARFVGPVEPPAMQRAQPRKPFVAPLLLL